MATCVYRAENEGGKKIYYIGMREGGNNYYCCDVPKNEPQDRITGAWTRRLCENGSCHGQRPTITKINIGGVVKDVMIIGAGL